MPTLSEASLPSPHAVHAALHRILQPSSPKLNKLPDALQLFAHLQLVSSQLRSEARRALRIHRTLMKKLDELDIQDKEMLDLGVLSNSQGEALMAVALKGEIPREDVMMELSFEFRLLHIAMAVSRVKNALPNVLIPLFETYFPLLSPPPEDDAMSREDAKHWQAEALRMEMYRQKGEALIQRAERHAANTDPYKGKLKLSDLLQNRTDESAKQLARDVLSQADKVVEDVETMQRIFAPEESAPAQIPHSEGEMPSVQDMPVEEYVESFVEEAHSMEDDYGSHDKPMLVIDKKWGRDRSPPPLRAFPMQPPSSSYKPFRGSSISSTPGPGPSALRVRQQYFGPGEMYSPTAKVLHRPRKSGLPPLAGPDYTSPRMSDHRIKEEMKPFDQSRVSRSPRVDKGKRSRMSMGVGQGSVEEEHRQKRPRESSY